MSSQYEIRANYDRETIVVYQAYDDAIAVPALEAQAFVAPFSLRRMTWIKPSFCWLMHRSNWGRKKGQQRTLAVRIKRSGWDEALRLGVLTSPEGEVFGDRQVWRRAFEGATVHVQWDTERSLKGAALDHYSIQVGLSRHIIERFTSEWIVRIDDLTATVEKIRTQLDAGKGKSATRHVPPERVYPISSELERRLRVR